MTTRNHTTNKALDRYMRSLPNKERIAKARDIREKLGISRSVLSDWRRGRSFLRQACVDKINEVIGVDIRFYVEK